MECALGEHINHAGLQQTIGHHDQGPKPDEGFPGAALAEKIIPGDDPGHKQSRDSRQRGHRVGHSVPGRSDPSRHHQQQNHDQPPLFRAHGAHFFQLCTGVHTSVFGIAYGGWMQTINQQGHNHQRHQARNTRADSPLQPGEFNVCDLMGKVGHQRIRRHAGQEHGGGSVGGMEAHQHQEGAEFNGGRSGL